MSIYRRGRIYWIELTSHGRRIRESTGTTDKKQAQEYHEKRKGELWRQAKLGEEPPVTWVEAISKWLRLKPRGLPDRYRISSFNVEPKQPLPLTSSSLKFLDTYTTAGSFNRSLALIVAIHNTVGVEPPKVERRKMPPGRTRWLTAEEWERLKKALAEESQVLHDAAAFTLETGLRENNVLNLEWSQVDLRGRRMWLEAPDMKGKAPLGLPLNDAACALLASRRAIHKRFVFPNPDTGQPYYKASNRSWYAALKKAKLYKRVPGSSRLEVCWHTLRHTWASWHRMNGTALDELQDLGGWKDPKMVRRYAHLSTEHLAEAAQRVKPVSLRYNAPKRRTPDTKSPTKGR